MSAARHRDREVFDLRLHLDDVGLCLFDDPSDLFEVCRERQRDALMTGRYGGEYRIGPGNRKLARERTIAYEHPDMIDPQPDQRSSLFGGLDLEDLHQHIAAPDSEEIM